MARNIVFTPSASGYPVVKIEMTGFNDGIIDQYENQVITAGISEVIVKSDERSASVVVSGNVILHIIDVLYCESQSYPISAFSDLPHNYASIL